MQTDFRFLIFGGQKPFLTCQQWLPESDTWLRNTPRGCSNRFESDALHLIWLILCYGYMLISTSQVEAPTKKILQAGLCL